MHTSLAVFPMYANNELSINNANFFVSLGIILPEPELKKEKEELLPEIAEDSEEDQETQEFDLEQAIADTERIVLEDMEKNQLTDQLMLNVQSMVGKLNIV